MAFPSYRAIDLETWPRREHFAYYRDALPVGYSLTCQIDVSPLLDFAHKHRLRFYGCLIYAVSRTVNAMDEMKLMLTPDGTPGIWAEVHPNFTVFHEDDHTFSDLWCHYDADFSTFYQNFSQTVEEFGHCHGVKGRPGQPANFFCVSCAPWLDFTGFSTFTAGGTPSLFPIVTCGRYTRHGETCTLPVTLTISHAAADGYHAGQFFQLLQENCRAFS